MIATDNNLKNSRTMKERESTLLFQTLPLEGDLILIQFLSDWDSKGIDFVMGGWVCGYLKYSLILSPIYHSYPIFKCVLTWKLAMNWTYLSSCKQLFVQ